MWSRAELKSRAWQLLKTSYWEAFLVSVIIVFAGGSSSPSFNFHFGGMDKDFFKKGYMDPSIAHSSLLPLIFAFIIAIVIVAVIVLTAYFIFLGAPIAVGGRRYFIRAAQNEKSMNHISFALHKGIYFDVVKAMLLKNVYNFLWFLLLIIPGIVKAYAYEMVPYILADNPNIGSKRAIALSKNMTQGWKGAMFVLDLSFLGWYLLGTLALFIGVLFVHPYMNATKAQLYLSLRQNALDMGMCSYEELLLTKTME